MNFQLLLFFQKLFLTVYGLLDKVYRDQKHMEQKYMNVFSTVFLGS